MAIGKVGSFATVEAPKDPLLDTLQNIEQVGFQKRAEQRAIDDKKAKAKKEDDDALALNLATFQGKPTGVYNLDNVQFGLAKESANAYAENEKKIRATTDPNEKAKYQLANLNLKNNFNNAKGGIDLFFNKYKEVQDRIKSGNINPEDEKDLLSDVQSLNNMGVRVDENGNWKFSTYQKDDKGNLTNVVVNDSDMNGVLGIMDRFSKSNYGDFKKQFLDDNKLSETEIQSGFTTETKKKVDERIKQQAMNAGIAIANQDSEMYQKLLEIDGVKKRKFTDEDRKRVADYVANDLVKSYGEQYKKDIDQAGILASQKRNDEKKKEEIQKTIANFTDEKDEATGKTFTTRNKKMLSFREKDIPFKNLGGSKSGLNSGFVSNFVLQNDDEVVIIGKALIDKGQKFKVGGKDVGLGQLFAMQEDNTNPQLQEEAKAALDSYNIAANYQKFVRTVGGDELGMLAAQAGYTSDEELKEELRRINGKKKLSIADKKGLN